MKIFHCTYDASGYVMICTLLRYWKEQLGYHINTIFVITFIFCISIDNFALIVYAIEL
jgi:hypothetical protein